MRLLFIVGPTASGKTALSFEVATKQPSEIINADIRQIFTPLSIGVAKPDQKGASIPLHLFDLYDAPTEISAVAFRRLVVAKVQEVFARGNRPIIVGGSMFYLKSLFFPPKEHDTIAKPSVEREQIPPTERWCRLKEIDPVRAQELHPNDQYRINRALDIYFQHGIPPSACKPIYDPIALPATIMALNPPRELLRHRISHRLDATLVPWIEEVEGLIDTLWESFWTTTGIIGYPEVAAYIRRGKRPEELPALRQDIFNQTCAYAKRQTCFWRSFYEALMPHIGEQLNVDNR